MSYSIQEELDDRRTELESLVWIADRWPNAHRLVYKTLDDIQFVVWRVDIPYSECDMFRLIEWESTSFGRTRATLMICMKQLAGGVAVVPIRHILHANILFAQQHMGAEGSELRAKLLEQFEKEATTI